MALFEDLRLDPLSPAGVEESCRAKIDRAREIAQTLRTECNEYVGRVRVSPTLEHSGPTPMGFHRFVIRLSVQPDVPRLRWGVLLGDVMHNLRSSLDQLAYGLVVAGSGQRDPDDEEAIGFPILKRLDRYRETSARKSAIDRKLRGATEEVRVLALDLQPHLRGEHGSTRAALSLINSLNIADKHAVRLEVGVFGWIGGIELLIPEGAPPIDLQQEEPAELRDGAIVARGMTMHAPPATVTLADPSFELFVRAGQRGLTGMTVAAVTEFTIEKTAYVVSVFAPALYGDPPSLTPETANFGYDAAPEWTAAMSQQQERDSPASGR